MPKILLVDDSTTAVALFQVFLAGKDTHLHVARDGAEALDAARRIVPDLIVSDVEMPRMDGFELCAAVRRDPRLSRVPVVLLTSRTDGASRRRGEEVGASAFLTKPASPAAVRSTVDDLLRAERARDATGMPSAATPVRVDSGR